MSCEGPGGAETDVAGADACPLEAILGVVWEEGENGMNVPSENCRET